MTTIVHHEEILSLVEKSATLAKAHFDSNEPRDPLTGRWVRYFAYGSNLDPVGMRWRAPDARRVGPATLKGHKLTFPRGVANVEPTKGMDVPGGIYELSPQAVASIDSYEGYPYSYGKKIVEVHTPKGPVTAMTYFMRPGKNQEERPSGSYLGSITGGLASFGQPTEGAERAARKTPPRRRSYYNHWDEPRYRTPAPSREVVEGPRYIVEQGKDVWHVIDTANGISVKTLTTKKAADQLAHELGETKPQLHTDTKGMSPATIREMELEQKAEDRRIARMEAQLNDEAGFSGSTFDAGGNRISDAPYPGLHSAQPEGPIRPLTAGEAVVGVRVREYLPRGAASKTREGKIVNVEDKLHGWTVQVQWDKGGTKEWISNPGMTLEQIRPVKERFQVKERINGEWELYDTNLKRFLRVFAAEDFARQVAENMNLRDSKPSKREQNQTRLKGARALNSIRAQSDLPLHPAGVKDFHDKLEQARQGYHGAWLTPYSKQELAKMQLYLSNDGKVGGAIKTADDGVKEIVGVFNDGGPKGAGTKMLNALAARGGQRLDCIGPVLKKLYERQGFRVVKTLKWDDSLAPDGWDYKDGRPGIYIMEKKPKK